MFFSSSYSTTVSVNHVVLSYLFFLAFSSLYLLHILQYLPFLLFSFNLLFNGHTCYFLAISFTRAFSAFHSLLFPQPPHFLCFPFSPLSSTFLTFSPLSLVFFSEFIFTFCILSMFMNSYSPIFQQVIFIAGV